MAELTITRRGVKRTYSVPDHVLDVHVAELRRCGLSRFRAIVVASRSIELYGNDKADLGYGLTATLVRS